MKKNINVENVTRLFSKRSSRDIFCEALKEILPSKDNYVEFLIISVCAFIPAIIIAISSDTINLFVKAMQTLNSTIITLFGIVFMGYAFFQALINEDLLIRLLNSPQKTDSKNKNNTANKSQLQESNEYFANVMMLDVFGTFVNCFMIITIGSIQSDFSLPIKVLYNNIIAFFGILIYFIIMFCIILEMKSFVFNTFQLFNAHAGSKALEILDKEKEEKS